MRSHSYAYCGLIGCLALFALGPMQLGKVQRIAGDSHLSDGKGAFQSSHAPVKLRTGPDSLVIHGPRSVSTSFNWAGYAIKSGTYKSASLSWTVPTVSYVNYPGAPTFEDSSTWVGIGGFGSNDLIQLGTEQKIEFHGQHHLPSLV